jgi:acyl-CoA synthetase (AMP-forming)/AMP-acid ligase II
MSSLVDYLDKGASLGRDAPCLVEGERTLTYGEVQDLSWRVAGALAASGVEPGGKVGILSSNNAVAFACVFGIARRGAVWCPINPRNEAAENRALLELFDCECLIYHPSYAGMVAGLGVETTVCLDDLETWLARALTVEQADPPGDLAMLVGTGGTTGLPKGVMLTARNLETMTALKLMG